MDLKQYWNYGELTNERQMVDERFGFFGNDNGFFSREIESVCVWEKERKNVQNIMGCKNTVSSFYCIICFLFIIV